MEDFIMNDFNPIPFSNQMYMEHFNLQPSVVKGRANTATEYYKRILYNKAYSSFEFELPEHWALNWWRFWLFHFGSIGVVYTKQFGWIAQPYSIIKLDFQFQPKDILVYNSFVKKPITGRVGVNCGIVHLFDDYFGIDDIVTRYAELLAQTERSLNVNLMNSNVTLLFEAQSKKQGIELKEAYNRATQGEPLVVLNKEVIDGKQLTTLIPSVKNNFIGMDLMEVRRAIVNAFLTEVGIRNISVQKKERLTQGETNENNDETKSLVMIMYENMKFCFDYINALSDLNLRVNLRYDYSEENVLRETSTENVSRET